MDLYFHKCSIAIDTLREIEKTINHEPERRSNSTDLRKVKEAYDKDFFRCCNELTKNQLRAKLSELNFQSQQDDPLLKLLSEADDDDD